MSVYSTVKIMNPVVDKDGAAPLTTAWLDAPLGVPRLDESSKIKVDSLPPLTSTYAPIEHASRHSHLQADAVSLDASQVATGTFDIARIPPAALERLVKVADDAARFALTTAQVQNGDTVQTLSNFALFLVVDDTRLSSEDGYLGYTASSDWSAITNKPPRVTELGAVTGTNDDVLQIKNNVVSTRSIAQLKTDLAYTYTEVGADASGAATGAVSTHAGLTSGVHGLGTAAGHAATDFATSTQGANADSHAGNSTSVHGLTIANVTTQGNSFNGVSQLVQTNGSGQLPALDGHLVTGVTATTAANLSGTPALPNGTTATTQSVGDNSTKLATTAFVLANSGSGTGNVVGPASAVNNNLAAFDTTTGKLIKDAGIATANVTAQGNSFNGASQLVQLTAATKYPALDGSLITNLPGAASTFSITYNSHGLTVGALSPPVPIAKIGASYALAKADSAANVEVIGLALAATDANTLTMQQAGTITRTAHGFTGPAIWLSALTAGTLTETAPSVAGQFLKPIAKVVDANTLEIVDYPATQISATGVYSTTFTSADSRITAGVLTVTHGLRQRPLFITLMDGSASPVDVYPGVVYTSDDTFTVDLSSFTITGTWTLVASKGAGAAMPFNNGMWTLVSSVPITSALPAGDGGVVTTFSNLNGDLDKRYMLVVSAIQGATAESGIEVYFNADNSGNHYWHQDFYGTGTSAAANVAGSPRNNIFVGYHTVGATHSLTFLEVDARSGSPRICDHRSTFGATGGITREVGAAIWNSTANITGMTIVADKANLVAAGSYIELWKLNATPVSAPPSEWVLQERYTVSGSAVTSKTFSGLNGNVDRRYKIVSRMINAIGVVTYGVYFNADTGNNYRYQGINSNNSAITGPTNVYSSVPMGSSRGSGIPMFMKGEIDAAAGYVRNATFHATAPTSGTSMTFIDNYATVWNNSADNITSMTVLGDQASGLGVGTYIELWKLGA